VTHSDFDAAARRLDIQIDFAAGSRFVCPTCGAPDCPAPANQWVGDDRRNRGKTVGSRCDQAG
jgi:hypothetical protein